LEAVSGSAESMTSMQSGVQSFGLEIETMKFMALFNLILLAVALYVIVSTIIVSLGASTFATPGVVLTTRQAIALLARQTAEKIASISIRDAMVALTEFFMRQLPTIARTAVPNLVRNTLPTLLRELPTLVRQEAGNLLRGMLPRNIVARGAAERTAAQWMR